MATIQAQVYSPGGQYRGYRWMGVTESDECAPVSMPDKGDKTFEVSGNFGTGGEVSLKGTINPEAEDFLPARSQHDGQPIVLTAPDCVGVVENHLLNCPAVTTGTGVSVDIFLFGREDA